MNIYVGNLSYNLTGDELRALFTEHGEGQKSMLSLTNILANRKDLPLLKCQSSQKQKPLLKHSTKPQLREGTLKLIKHVRAMSDHSVSLDINI
jgi:RNA recognition motif-containing protein